MKSLLKPTVALAGALAIGLAGTATAATTMLDPFTQPEIDANWVADRAFPTDGVESVEAFGRTDVARLGIDSNQTAPGTFQRTEGIKSATADNFGSTVQVDLYVDPAWEDTATRAGLWVVGDDGAGNRDNLFGIVEFVNLETSTSGDSAQADHTGWRIWDSATGWTNVDADYTYGQWVTLTITLDTTAGMYSYAIDGEDVGTAVGGTHYVREVFLNSYNYGLDTFPTLENGSYAAHWHAGLNEVDDRDQCVDGSWEELGFRNQGQCIRFVNTGVDTR